MVVTNDGGYIAKFTADSVKTIVAYGIRGAWHYTLRYYNEKKLPHDVRTIVKRTYYDYDILGAVEELFATRIFTWCIYGMKKIRKLLQLLTVTCRKFKALRERNSVQKKFK